LSFRDIGSRWTDDCSSVTSAAPPGSRLTLKMPPPTLDFARLPPKEEFVATRLAVVSNPHSLPYCE
jgi:hypothetical protein